MTFVVQVLATLVPENNIRMSDFGPLMLMRDQVPHLLSWAQGYSFSRDVNLSTTAAPSLVDEYRLNSWHCCDRGQFPFTDSEEDIRLSRRSLTSTSLSAAEYLEKFTALTSTDRMKKNPEEEADLVKPRLEYFWQNNGLLVQMQSPSR